MARRHGGLDRAASSIDFWDGASHHVPADERLRAEDDVLETPRESGVVPNLPLLTAQADRAVFRMQLQSSEAADPPPERRVPGASRLRILTDFLASRGVAPGTSMYNTMLRSERTYTLARMV